jgi:nucleoside-diphosphate-sugar epimerase
MKVLITGAAGFIGSHMAELLQRNGFSVTGLDNFSDYYSPTLKMLNAAELMKRGIAIHKIDLCQPDQLKALNTDFEFIFHFAARPGISAKSSFEDYLDNNVTATRHLLDFAQNCKNLKHFFNISTSSVYGREATLNEADTPAPISWYGVTKLAAEQLVLAASRNQKIKASSLRLYSVYGPRERPDKLYTRLISCGLSGEEFPLFEGSESHRRSFTYVGDICEGIYAALQNHKEINSEIINLGCETEHSTSEGIDIVEKLLGEKIKIKPAPARAGDQLFTKANISKAKKLLGYNPKTSLEEGLARQLEWYKTTISHSGQ